MEAGPAIRAVWAEGWEPFRCHSFVPPSSKPWLPRGLQQTCHSNNSPLVSDQSPLPTALPKQAEVFQKSIPERREDGKVEEGPRLDSETVAVGTHRTLAGWRKASFSVSASPGFF